MCCLAVYVFVLRGRREKKKGKKTLPDAFSYSCRESPVLDLIFGGRHHSTVKPCSNFRKQIVGDRFWFLIPDNPVPILHHTGYSSSTEIHLQFPFAVNQAAAVLSFLQQLWTTTGHHLLYKKVFIF